MFPGPRAVSSCTKEAGIFYPLILSNKKKAMTVAPLHAWLVIIVHIKHSMSEIDCSYFYGMPSTRSLMQRKTLKRQV